ncbi:MAG: HlyD family efflux transporter periplasmic adaptor subunit [Bacteroidia bacterium]|nr:HlyD family efflux transporter periplasmic adaptor subunit [Bacteroidia bacterium]
MKQNKLLKIGGAVVVLLIIGLVIARSQGWLGDANAIKVTVEDAVRTDITEIVSADGKVQPEVEVKISADVSGEIVELAVKEGQVIKKGTLLAKIRSDIYESILERASAAVKTSQSNFESTKAGIGQAQSQFDQAKKNYIRNKKLFDDGVISESEFEVVRSTFEVAEAALTSAQESANAAKYNVQSARASLREASESVQQTAVYSPVDGTISRLNVELGEKVVGVSQMAGTELMRIANLNEMEVSADVGENDIIRVHLNDTVLIEVDAYRDDVFKGIVTEIANSADQAGMSLDQVTNFKVKIRILSSSYKHLLQADNPDYSPFRPGMSATVEIQTNTVRDVLAVPIQAVSTRDTVGGAHLKKDGRKKGGSDESEVEKVEKEKITECVFIDNNGEVEFRAVKTGIQNNKHIQILEGLDPSDKIITGPYSAVSKKLKHGDKIKVVEKSELFSK